MALTEIKASKKIGDVEKEAAIAYDFGANLDEAVAKFGAEVVFTNFKRTAVITAQAAIRRMIEDDKPIEEITSKMASWKPGVALERVIDPVASLVGRWDSYSQEEQNEILKKLKSKTKR